MIATSLGHLGTVIELISAGVLDYPNSKGETALSIAKRLGCKDIVKMLGKPDPPTPQKNDFEL